MEIITNEKDEHEALVKDSTRLLTVLHEYEHDKEHKYLAKYINVLFGLKCSKIDYDKLNGICNAIYYSAGQGYDVKVFDLQKGIKDYLANIDSTLDYLHKFLSELKDKNNRKIIDFDRESLEFANDINDFRNEVLHEGVPTISFDEQNYYESCHTNTSGVQKTYYLIKVRFNDSKKEYNLKSFIDYTYSSTRKKVQEVTNKILNIFQ